MRLVAGIDWKRLRSLEAPQLAAAPAPPDREFDWELRSLASALPSFITGEGAGTSPPGTTARGFLGSAAEPGSGPGTPLLQSAAAVLFGSPDTLPEREELTREDAEAINEAGI